jgi:hypothetical protein
VKLPKLREDEKKPAPWWTSEDDRSLLLGSYKYGYSEYEVRPPF